MRLFLISSILIPGILNSNARAEDFLRSGAGARSAASGGVYLPGSQSVLDAMAINPAGLSLLGGPVLEVSVAGLLARGRFDNRANSNAPLRSQGIVPFGAFGAPVTSRVTVGFAATPELMSAARWRYVDTPGGAGGISYGLLSNNSEIVAFRTSAGVGVSLNSAIQIGATFGSVWNANKLQTAYVFQNHPDLAGLKTALDLRTSGIGWNGSLGALFRPARRLHLGVAWKSRTTVASRGTAEGNAGVQFAKVGLGAARPDFRYNAQVDNVLPQSVVVHAAWHASARTRYVLQADWVNWKQAFVQLPLTLTKGINADINGLLATDSITDAIPLHWKDQFTFRAGIERSWLERAKLRAGYSRATVPVPGSTLTPLTAAITANAFSAGAGYEGGRTQFDIAYTIDPAASRRTAQSALKAGEYSNSRVRVATHCLMLTTGFRF